MQRLILCLLAAGILAGCAQLGRGRGPAFTVVVEAGAFDRQGTVVSFPLPENLTGAAYRLVDERGGETFVQVDAERRASFILNELQAGAARTYRLEPASARMPVLARSGVAAQPEKGAVVLTVEGSPVLRYNADRTPLPQAFRPVFQRGGYIHPVMTPSGRVITDDYPPNHIHHHGIWAAWTKTEFEGRKPDFWNMGDSTGTVEPVALDATWSGLVHGGFRARHRYVDLSAPQPRTALNETWEVQVYNLEGNARPYRVFDLEVTQQTATSSPLRLPEYHYGGVGFRGRREWDGEKNTFFLTSEGKDRSNGHATRARWCHISGLVDGELAGVAILGHPANFRAPQPMRIHPNEPFFNWAPSQGGDWSIQPGETYVARYRYVVFDGKPDADELDRLWNDYAHPPAVRISGTAEPVQARR